MMRVTSDIKEETVKQAIPKGPSVSKEENKHDEEINLTPQDKTDNIDWCKCRC